MIHGYIRADKRNEESQKMEIGDFATRTGLAIDLWTENIGNAGEGDIVVASEITLLGKDFSQIMETLGSLLGAGAQVWTAREGYKLGGDALGRELASAFGLSAEIKRKMHSQAFS